MGCTRQTAIARVGIDKLHEVIVAFFSNAHIFLKLGVQSASGSSLALYLDDVNTKLIVGCDRTIQCVRNLKTTVYGHK